MTTPGDRPSGRFWPWFVAALLVATAAGQGVMLYQATHDSTFAVEPDYYARAVAFDSTMALERASAALRWTATARLAATPAGAARLEVRLADSTGAPVTRADVRVELVSNLDASHPVRITLDADGNGTYAARLPALRRGLWDVRVSASAGAARFVETIRMELSS